MPISETPRTMTTPPPKRASTSKTTTPRVSPETVKKDRTEAVAGIFQLISGVLAAGNQWADAGAIEMHGGTLATEIADMAGRYESLGEKLDNLSGVTPFLGLATVGMALTLQIATNHKWVKKETGMAFGAIPPDVLEGEMRLKATQRAFVMQMEQAEREAAMRADMEERQRAMEEMMSDA